jgi:hypothetical protein
MNRAWRADLYPARLLVSTLVGVQHGLAMTDRIARARGLVEQALREVEAELASPRTDLCPIQLGTCRDMLRHYALALESGNLPPRKDRAERLCRLVVDGWPFETPLAGTVLAAERAFRTA